MSLFEFVKEDLVDEPNAKLLTEPIRSDIVQVWKSSFERWGRWSDDDRRRLAETHTARPGVLNAFAQSFARELFQDREDEGIIPCDGIPGVFAFYVQNKVLIRFNVLCSNHTVRFAGSKPYKRKYLLQEPLPKLNNSASRLTAGYMLDESKTMIESIHISMQLGPDSIFHFQIDEDVDGTMAFPSPESAPPLLPPAGVIAKKNPR